MGLVLGVSDNRDGTGGVATISGSDALSSNSLYAAPFSGPTGPQSWSLVGTRTGDGTITTNLQGAYLWQAFGTVSSAFAFASYFRWLTNTTTESVWDRVLTAVVQQIQTLNLAGVSNSNINRYWRPRRIQGVDSLPAIQAFPLDGQQYLGLLTGLDDIGYPVGIAIIDQQNQDFQANMTSRLLWREQIDRIFRYQRLSGVPEIIICRPGRQVVLGKEFGDNLYTSLGVYNFISREVRGSTP